MKRRGFLQFLGLAPVIARIEPKKSDAPIFPGSDASPPSISFRDDTDTGFYRDGSEAIKFVAGGVERK